MEPQFEKPCNFQIEHQTQNTTITYYSVVLTNEKKLRKIYTTYITVKVILKSIIHNKMCMSLI